MHTTFHLTVCHSTHRHGARRNGRPITYGLVVYSALLGRYSDRQALADVAIGFGETPQDAVEACLAQYRAWRDRERSYARELRACLPCGEARYGRAEP